MSLLARLYLLITLAVLPALGIQIFDQIELRRERVTEVGAIALQLARVAASETDRIVEGARGILVAISELPFVKTPDRAACSAYLTELIKKYPQFQVMVAVDVTGAPFCASAPEAFATSAADRPYFQEAVRTGGFVIGEYTQRRVPPYTPALPLALPFRGPQGEIRGVVIAALNLDWLVDYFKARPLPSNAVLAIADRQGTLLARLPAAQREGLALPPDLLEKLGAGEAGQFERTSRDGFPQIVGYMPIDLPPRGLFISIAVPRDMLFAEIDRTTRRDTLMTALSGTLALLAAFVGGRIFMRRPVKALMTTARHWQAGEYGARAEMSDRGSELGQLGAVFNEMAQAVESREAALRDSNAALEIRVAERTADLAEANERLREEMAQREHTEAALRQAQKMEAVGQLTGGIAHDFNNILTVILGNLDSAIRRFVPPDGELGRLLAAAVRGAERAAHLTHHLLAFSRRQPLAPSNLDLNKLIAGMSDMLRRTLGPSIAIETVAAGGLWRSFIDANQLESALLNLVLNARDAMPEGGKVTIETANAFLDEAYSLDRSDVTPGQYVMLAVSDNGTGMSTEIAAKAFDPFFTTKAPGKGSGLGLSMVFGFAKQSGGHAAIYSELDHGTTVKLYFPRHLAENESDPPAAAPAPPGEARQSETILVVEDDEDVRAYAVSVLRELGYRVVEAGAADAALAVLEGPAPIDLIFTDVGLPGVNGRKLVERARSLRPGLRAVFTTGYTRNAIVHHGVLDAGVQMIGKPFTAAGLAAMIRKALAVA